MNHGTYLNFFMVFEGVEFAIEGRYFGGSPGSSAPGDTPEGADFSDARCDPEAPLGTDGAWVPEFEAEVYREAEERWRDHGGFAGDESSR